MNVLNKISKFTYLNKEEIATILLNAKNSYKKIYIKKRNGGTREIYHPARELKTLQYAFKNLYLDEILIHDSAMAYVKGKKSPLKNNALIHSKFDYSIRIDFKDFFPSITFYDLKLYFENNNIKFNDEDLEFIDNIIFPLKHISKGLPIGSPISPIVSNIVMTELDNLISAVAIEINGINSYTRYSDDIIFSSNNYDELEKFKTELTEIIENNSSPNLRINQNKTLFMGKTKKRIITGLVVTPDNIISIGRERKRMVKSLSYMYINNRLDNKETIRLKGLLSFILDVEPDFYSTLVNKYSSNLNEIFRR